MDLQARLEAQIKREPLSCFDIEAAMGAVDFVALGSRNRCESDTPDYTVDDGVATIYVRGLLVDQTPYDWIEYGVTGYNIITEYLEAASNDSRVSQIVLDVDSGGGFVSGLAHAAKQIELSDKPVSCFISGNALSAAYWLASSAEVVTSVNGAEVGSIGVYMVHADESKALEEAGIKISLFQSGFWKGAFSNLLPLSDRAAQRLQQSVDDSAAQFFEHVAANRKLSVSAIKALEGDYFLADKALALGLIDAISEAPTLAQPGGGQAQASADILPTALAAPPNPLPTDPKEQPMDLAQAQAKIGDLEAQVAAKQTELEAEAAKVAELQAAKRDGEIKALEQKRGQAYSDEFKQKLKALDDTAFEVLAEHTAPKAELPSELFAHQATAGQSAEGQSLDASLDKYLGANA